MSLNEKRSHSPADNPSEEPSLETLLATLLTSFSFLFLRFSPEGSGKKLFPCSDPLEKDLLITLKAFLLQAEKEIKEKQCILLDQVSSQTDSLDICNHLLILFSGKNSLRHTLDDCLFSALLSLITEDTVREKDLREIADNSTFPGLCIQHALCFARSLASFLTFYPAALQKKDKDSPPRLLPTEEFHTLSSSFFCRSRALAVAMELETRRKKKDIFERERILRYRKGVFKAADLSSIRKVNEFYGCGEAKRILGNHFSAFSAGRHNIPLLISGLPGLGKTQMTIAHVLEDPALSLILASPEDLEEGLENLIALLKEKKEKKFVIFFDDVDVRDLDWYYFRTFVGGSCTLPENQMIVIASNYYFPPNISSRGRSFSFPLFDEIRCQEMIEDMFLTRGMEHISSDLLSVIAADYVENFGQKEFDELSPRTLARYLDLFLADQGKRKRLLDFSKGEIITRPDPLIFHEQNVRLIKALYGEEAVDELRQSQMPC